MDARTRLFLALLIVSPLSSEASGQRAADLQPPGFSNAVPDGLPDAWAFAFDQQPTPDRDSFVATTAVSAMFGGIGAVIGAFVGGGMGPNTDEAELWAVRGAFVGAWAGAGLGGTAVSRRPDLAFLGSALGILPGFAIIQDANDGRDALLGLLVLGMVTAFVTQAGS